MKATKNHAIITAKHHQNIAETMICYSLELTQIETAKLMLLTSSNQIIKNFINLIQYYAGRYPIHICNLTRYLLQNGK